MYNLCVFAGTTEGRKLVEYLADQPVVITACVATEYGEDLLEPAENLTVSAHRMPPGEIESMLREQKFDLVIDATHPYAASITQSIEGACRKTHTDYLRLLREAGACAEGAVYVDSAEAAVAYLNTVEGNILLTTGSKELEKYTQIRDFSQRVYARVLPMTASLEACQSAGVKPGHIIAMQGPFSEEMNTAMLRGASAGYLVTKDGGDPGGFGEKVSAAKKTGAKLVVIGRPPQRAGISLAETIDELCRRFGLKCQPDVTVVGIGPGSRDAMTKEVLAAIDNADCLIGAERMLQAVSHSGQAAVAAISPSAIAQVIFSHREYRRFAVVMSGDVSFFSGTKKLLPLLEACNVRVLPGISSLSYLCAKLKTDYEDVVPVSLHGRDHDIIRDVRSHARVFALVGGEQGMRNLCTGLVKAGLGHVKMSIGQRLSYPEEKITVGTALELQNGDYAALSVALIENDRPDAVVTPGLPDALFRRGQGEDGIIPMTKSEVRAVCLSKLQLTRQAVCWDVGAGTGSVAIEMGRLSPEGTVFAIEKKRAAASLLRENIQIFGAENVTAVTGSAPEACEELPAPTHVFIGGSGGNMKEILKTVLSKNSLARIVATAISLESIAELTACMKTFGFSYQEVVSLTVARDKAAGQYHLMAGQNPIYIFTMQESGGAV